MINHYLGLDGQQPSMDLATDFKKVANKVSTQSQELDFSNPNLYDDIFKTFSHNISSIYGGNSWMAENTNVFRDLFNELHKYNYFIQQNISTYSEVFKGSFAFISDDIVLFFYKTNIINQSQDKVEMTPRMLKIDLTDAADIPISNIPMPTNSNFAFPELVDKLTTLKFWLNHILEDESLPSGESASDAIINTPTSNISIEQVLELVSSNADIITYSYSNILLDKSILTIYANMFGG